MRTVHLVVAALALGLGLPACGGGSNTGDPLVVSDLTGDFNGVPFTPRFGFARDKATSLEIFIGSGAISCADDFMGQPRDGTYIATSAPEIGVGVFSNALFQFIQVTSGEVVGGGSNAGTVNIMAINADEVGLQLSYDATPDTIHFGLNGLVTLVHCP